MPTISSLWVELKADASGFNSALKDAQKEAKELEKVIKPTLTAAKDLGVAFTAAGGAITGAMYGMVKASADYGETLNKVSIQTGITTEKLSALKYMAEQEETSFDALTVGLKKMSVTAVQNAAAFEGIGVKVKESNGAMRPMNDILLDAAKRFAGMSDETKRTALEVEIFGRSGSDLNELLLRLGKEGLDPSTQKVRQLGLEMSGNAAKAADDFNDSVTEIEGALLGVANAVAGALLPSLTDNTKSLRDAIEGVKDFVSANEDLTKAIALTGIALTGAGGLLLGLAGVVTIYPKVVAGLNAIGTALSAIGAVNAVVATAGLAAVVYWATQVISTQQDLAATQRYTNDQIQQNHDLIMKQWDALEKLGIVVEHGSLTWDEFGAAVRKATMEHSADILKMSQKQTEFHTKTAAEIQAELVLRQKQAKIEDQIGEATAKEFIDQHKEMVAQSNQAMEEFWKKREDDQRYSEELGKAAASDFIEDHKRMVRESDTAMDEFWKKQEAAQKVNDELGTAAAADFIADHKHALAVSDAAMDDFWKKREKDTKAFRAAIENLNTRLAQSFADMIVNAKFNFDSLVSIAKQTVSNILSAFISGLISPLTNQLAALGARIAGSIGLGGKTGGVGGTTGGIGGGIGGLFGLSGAATLGIGAAVGGVALLASHFIGQGRKTADEFVNQFQNPFGQQLAQVSANGSVSDLDAIWKTFNDTASQFASQGGNEAKVVSQAHATLDPLVAQIRSDLAAKEAAATVNVTVQGNAYAGIEDVIVQAILDALATNRGGLATAIG